MQVIPTEIHILAQFVLLTVRIPMVIPSKNPLMIVLLLSLMYAYCDLLRGCPVLHGNHTSSHSQTLL